MSDLLQQLAEDAENTFYSLSIDNVEEGQQKKPVQSQNLNDINKSVKNCLVAMKQEHADMNSSFENCMYTIDMKAPISDDSYLQQVYQQQLEICMNRNNERIDQNTEIAIANLVKSL